MNNPIMWQGDMILDHWNIQPSVVKGRANAGTEFHKRWLYKKIYSTLDFTIPADWKLNFFRFLLFHFGSLAVIYTNEYGWVCQPYSVVKLDLYYNPKVIQVYNSFIKTPKIGAIGVNAGIIKCFDDYFGFDDIVTRYATDLAQCDKDIEINLMNSNVAAFFEAKNKKDADAIYEAYGQATTGKPFVVINRDIMDEEDIKTLLPNIKNNYIVNDLLLSRRQIINSFLTEIGIRNANYDKRERLNSAEVNENNDETSAVIGIVYKNIKAGMQEIRKFADIPLDVRMHYDYESEGSIWLD